MIQDPFCTREWNICSRGRTLGLLEHENGHHSADEKAYYGHEDFLWPCKTYPESPHELFAERSHSEKKVCYSPQNVELGFEHTFTFISKKPKINVAFRKIKHVVTYSIAPILFFAIFLLFYKILT